MKALPLLCDKLWHKRHLTSVDLISPDPWISTPNKEAPSALADPGGATGAMAPPKSLKGGANISFGPPPKRLEKN